MKNLNYPIGNRTHDLLVCSAVPNPTAPPRTPLKADGRILLKLVWNNVWGSWVAMNRIQVGWIHVAQDRAQSETGLMTKEPALIWYRTGCCGKKLGVKIWLGSCGAGQCAESLTGFISQHGTEAGLLWTFVTVWKLLKKFARYQDQLCAPDNVTHSVWYFHVWSDKSACIGVTMAYRVRLRLPYAHPYGVCRGLQRYIMTQEGISIVDVFLFSVSRLRINLFWFFW